MQLDADLRANRFKSRTDAQGNRFFAATSGWSLEIDTSVALEEVPRDRLPSVLYHGTAQENRRSMESQGLHAEPGSMCIWLEIRLRLARRPR